MTPHDQVQHDQARIGRPPKVDADGTPTRERLLRAAIESCVEFGYEGATLADIARRAEVSTPAVYSHFDGKAALLVEASKHALDAISTSRLPGQAGIREIARYWLRPDFASTRVLVAELHCAAIRQPEVAALLAAWQADNAVQLMRLAGLTPAQVKAVLLRQGVIFVVGPDSYRVRLKLQKADEAYDTDDLDDALETGLMIGAAAQGPVVE